MRKYIRVLVVLSVALLAFIACSPQPTDPVSVTEAFFTAINQGKAEAAVNCFAKDGELISVFGQPKGIDSLRNYFQKSLIPLKTKLDVVDLKADGENVTGTFIIANSETNNVRVLLKLVGVVQAGKIKTMTWTTNK
jgi:limonene-1,2-epoxide hydrolase